jgi:ABC-type branched-subunit amino acid transport system substrate-binding protein
MPRTAGLAVVAAVSAAALGLASGCSTKSDSGSPDNGGSRASSSVPSASGTSGPGVTADAIKVGITYPNLAAIRNVVNIDHGDYQAAYNAVINDLNQHGGINGRKLVPVYAPINPIGTAPADAACTKLTEDAKVLVVFSAFLPNPQCYLNTHATALVGGATISAAQAQGARAPWFSYNLSPEHQIPKLLTALNKDGVFKDHKVAVTSLAADEASMRNTVLPQLKRLGVTVVANAVNSAPTNDVNAGYQQFGVIAKRFQADGADVVIAVGDAGTAWPKALQVNRSTYLPRVVATDYTRLAAYAVDNSGGDPTILKGAISGQPSPPFEISWNDPRLQQCIAIVKKAEPQATINNPITADAKTPNTWVSPMSACQSVALFVDMAKAAGSVLNNDTLNRGGESLTNVVLPGFGGSPLHYGPNSHDGDAPIYLGHYDEAKKNLVLDQSPA